MRAALLLGLAIAGCGKRADDPTPPKRNEEGELVRVADEGREPKSSIRWRPAVGKSRTLIFTTREGPHTTREQVEVRLPTMTATGDYRYEATLQLAESIDAPGSDRERALKHAQGTLLAASVTRLGNVRESDIQGDPSTRVLHAWLRWGVVPFPEMPIGAGATWETDGAGGHTRWELVANDGTRAVVRFRDEMAPGTLVAAAGPIAEGEVVVDLTRAPADKITVTVRQAPGDARPEVTISSAPAEQK